MSIDTHLTHLLEEAEDLVASTLVESRAFKRSGRPNSGGTGSNPRREPAPAPDPNRKPPRSSAQWSRESSGPGA